MDFTVTGWDGWTHQEIGFEATSPGTLSSAENGKARLTVPALFTGVITVTAKNENSGLQNGTSYAFTVTATNAAGTGPASTPSNAVTPEAALVSVTGVSLDRASLTLVAGGASETLTATVLPVNASNRGVAWSSSDPSVATVDSAGVVAPVGAGTATVTVTTADGGYTAACNVRVLPAGTVIEPVTAVSLSPRALNLHPGGTVRITATVSPSDATIPDLTWSTSDPAVATVDGSGLVTAHGVGTATVTARNDHSGLSDTCTVTVTNPPSGSGGGGSGSRSSGDGGRNTPDATRSTLSLSGLPDTVRVGDSFTLRPSADTRSGSDGWAWDEAYFTATFNSPATFTALREGTTKIIYTGLVGSTTLEVEILAAEEAPGPGDGPGGTGNPETGDDGFTGWVALFVGSLLAAALALPKPGGKRGRG